MFNRSISAACALALAMSLTACNGDDNTKSLNEYVSQNSEKITLDSTLPQNMEEAAPIDEPIYVFFDSSLNVSDTKDKIVLKRFDTDEEVAATSDIRGATYILRPEANLDYSTEYYIENIADIKNAKGNTLKNNLYVKFKTKDIYIPVTPPTYSPEDGENIAPSGEIYLPVTEERAALHAENHDYAPAVTATLPAIFDAPTMESIEDNIIHRDEMVAINPAPNEYLWVMEGQRHGFNNLTVVLTHTIPGNGAPLHTHTGEEAHILLQGTMYYQLGDKKVTVNAPYILNIPPMVPHGFINVGKETANLVGVFPESNHWEYDVLDYDIFSDYYQSLSAHDPADQPSEWLKDWYSEDNRKARLKALSEQHPAAN